MVELEMSWRTALLLAVCTPAIGCAITLVGRDVERRAAGFLAAFLVLACVSISPQMIGFAGFYDRWPNLTFVPLDAELYLPGLFYLHVSGLLDARIRARRYWMLAPGVAQTVYSTIVFVALPDHLSKWAYAESIHVPYVIPLQVVTGAALTVLALVWTARALARYRVFLEATESTDELFDPAWVRRSIGAVAAVSVVWTVFVVHGLIAEPTYVRAYPVWVGLGIAISALGFAALAGIREPFPKLGLREPVETVAGLALQNSRSGAERDWRAEGDAIRRRFVEGGWHRESRLSIRDVAVRMASNETYVSRALNEGMELSFRAFVNGLRIAQARRELADTDDPVLDIAMRAGFGSKATFNRVFRERVGMTPTAFRRSQTPEKP